MFILPLSQFASWAVRPECLGLPPLVPPMLGLVVAEGALGCGDRLVPDRSNGAVHSGSIEIVQ